MGKGHGTGSGKGAMNHSGQQNQQSTVFMTTSQPMTAPNARPQYRDKTERIAVPAMPMPAAVVCCILNFLFPGLGTFCAGFSSFCCSRNEDIDGAGRCVSCMLNCGIAFAQLATFILCFIGWFWSCAWGVFFIGMSAEYYHNNRIAVGGGYINQPPAQNGMIITSVVTNQPAQQTTSFNQQPIQPPAYSAYPPPGQEKVTGTQPQYPPQYPPPPAYPY